MTHVKNLSPMSRFKLSIIIPVYNEINTLPQVIERVLDQPFDLEIIIVDDCSTDGTQDYLKRILNPNIKIIFHKENQGKGGAIRTAQSHVSGDFVIIQDADLEYQPEEYGHLLVPLLSGQADVVYGSRFLDTHQAFSFWNFFANKILNLLTNVLYNTILTDMECGYKAFRADIFKAIRIKSNGFDLEPELTAKIFKQKLKVVEIPITYFGRSYSEGKKISWRDFFPAVRALIKYRFVD